MSVDTDEESTPDFHVENAINLSLLDPSRFGWTASGGIANLLCPHERAKQRCTKKQFAHSRPGKKRARRDTSLSLQTDEALLSVESDCPPFPVTNLDNFAPPAGSVMQVTTQQITAETDCIEEPTLSSHKKIANIKFKALQKDGVGLDVRCYHRGREASEVRNPHTWNLSFDNTPQTCLFTNSTLKSWVANVTIQFPLDDEDNTYFEQNHDIFIVKRKSHINEPKLTSFYRENINWNLADPETPTPIMYANAIAAEFGLSYVQTMELSESIQLQLQQFVQENCYHHTPIALRGSMSLSPSQHLLDLKPVSMVPTLFGEVTGCNGLEGFCHVINQKSKNKSLSRSSSTLSTRSATKIAKSSERNNCVSHNQTGNKNASNKKPNIKNFSNKSESNKSGIVKSANNKCESRSSESIQCSSKRSKRELPLKLKKNFSQPKSLSTKEIGYSQIRLLLKGASKKEIKEKGSSDLILYEDYFCHICQEERSVCAVFACCTLTHAYCDYHLSEKLKLTIDETEQKPLSLEYCPICALLCDCKVCVSKLEFIVSDLTQQDLSPNEEISNDNLLEKCRLLKSELTLESVKNGQRKNLPKSDDIFLSTAGNYSKVPTSEFPREVADGVDLDNGYDIYYNTIFTSKGSFLVPLPTRGIESNTSDFDTKNLDSAVVVSRLNHSEDGNVDFCTVCKSSGNLLCCDLCPRAFHNECMPVNDRHETSKETWECPCCRKEKEILPEDLVTGDRYFLELSTTYSDVATSWNSDSNTGIRLLSVLADTVQRLINYDFGFMFQQPVDVEQIPTYSTVVKKPMDLGSIIENLLKGHYKDFVKSTSTSLDDIVVAILNDIELVWHNCFIFNTERSVVYRMANVQRIRSYAIRRASVDHFLSEAAKRAVTQFAEACDSERKALIPDLSSFSIRHKAKHKIAGTSPLRGGKGRPVAVMDMETGRIVKIYATMQSACNVVNFFINELNFSCEVPKQEVTTLGKLRTFMLHSRCDISKRLFGYRWLLLEDLQGQRVSFPNQQKSMKKSQKSTKQTSMKITEPSIPSWELSLYRSNPDWAKHSISCCISMKNDESSYLFNSVEEALSFPGIIVDTASKRKQLVELAKGSELTDEAGYNWINMDSDVDIDTSTTTLTQKSNEELSRNTRQKIIKLDLLSGVTLITFHNIHSAFRDWNDTLDAAVLGKVDRSIECFKFQFLDQKANVDGISWMTVHAQTQDHFGPLMEDGKPLNRLKKILLSGRQNQIENELGYCNGKNDTGGIVRPKSTPKRSSSTHKKRLKNGLMGKNKNENKKST